MNLSFVYRQFALPMYVFLFTIPTKINFNFATYRITFRPYRLEMQAKVGIGDAKNLYEYWGELL